MPKKPNNGNPSELEIPPNLRLALNEQAAKVDRELAYWLALHDSDLLRAIKEDEICEKFSMTREQLGLFRRQHRLDIERCRDEIFALKRKMHLEVNDRLSLLQAMREAMLRGDKDRADSYRKALSVSEGLIPAEALQQYAGILERLDERQPAPKGGASVNINFGAPGEGHPLQSASEKLEAIRKAKREKIIEVEPITETKP